MRRNRRDAAGLLALGLLIAGPRARADSDATTTISAQDHALTRSESAVSLSPAMPSAPPALSTAGAPDGGTAVSSRTAPVPVAALASPAPVTAAVPASAPPIDIMDARDGEGKVISGRGKRKTAVPGGGLIVDEKGRRLEVVPQGDVPPSKPAVKPPAAPAPAAPASAPPLSGTVPTDQGSPKSAWRLVLGVGAVVAALGIAFR